MGVVRDLNNEKLSRNETIVLGKMSTILVILNILLNLLLIAAIISYGIWFGENIVFDIYYYFMAFSILAMGTFFLMYGGRLLYFFRNQSSLSKNSGKSVITITFFLFKQMTIMLFIVGVGTITLVIIVVLFTLFEWDGSKLFFDTLTESTRRICRLSDIGKRN